MFPRFHLLAGFVVLASWQLAAVWAVERVPTTISDSPPQDTAELDVDGYADLQALAKRRAAREHVAEPPLVSTLAELDYEQYREIQFRHEEAIWSDAKHPFWLEFFHRGFVQRDRVDVYVIEPSENDPAVRRVDYRSQQFHFGDRVSDLRVPDDVGFAGLKVAGRFEPAGDPQELLTFIGSSYFRSRSADTVYGTSARGLAIDVGMNQDEEFPDFQTFWVKQPQPDEKTLTVLALLDGPSLTGAYEFVFDPGREVSRMDVTATLYFRRQPDKLAIAPLTSMWMWGDGLAGPPLDDRPAVHDCDGLLIHADNQWQWRALARLPYPSVTSTAVQQLEGFGLLQRNREADRYRDSNARYHDRPSVWVQPSEPFGSGRVELIEIPGAHEGIDNIGAYFVSDSQCAIDVPLSLKYSVFFFGNEAALEKTVTPLQTMNPQTQSETPRDQLATCRGLHVRRDDERIVLTLEFVCAKAMHRTAADVDATIGLVRGELLLQNVVATPQGYLVNVAMRPTEQAPVEVELVLQTECGTHCSETLRYLCPHDVPTFVYPAIYTRQE